MKHTFLSLIPIILFAANAEAVTIRSSNPTAALLESVLASCMQQELGADGYQKARGMALQMNDEVVSQCKAGQNGAARTIAVSYSQTREGSVALSCAKQLKPLVAGQGTQQLLGGYAPMVNQLASGEVPQDVCGQITTNGAKYGGVKSRDLSR